VSLTNDEKLITVCAECKMACCWQGIFMCDDAVSADVIKISIGELRKLGLHEHPSYWMTDEEFKIAYEMRPGLLRKAREAKSELESAIKASRLESATPKCDAALGYHEAVLAARQRGE